MDGKISILNDVYTVENATDLKIEQLENGDWVVEVDGDVRHKGEFAPNQIEISDT